MLKELTNYPSLASLREATTRGSHHHHHQPVDLARRSLYRGCVGVIYAGRDLTPVQPSLVPTDEGLVIAMPGDRLHWASRGSVASRGFNRMLVPLPSPRQGDAAGPGRQSYALIVDPNPPLTASL